MYLQLILPVFRSFCYLCCWKNFVNRDQMVNERVLMLEIFLAHSAFQAVFQTQRFN